MFWSAILAWTLAVPAALAAQPAHPGNAGIVTAQSGGAPKVAKTPAAAKASPSAPGPLAAARSWGYQLRGIDPAAIAGSAYDIVVIDFADREVPFTAAEVQAMRTKPDGGRRYVLAYLSIGEAERYRAYWQPTWHSAPPAWLGPENPEWRGNFPVRFWDPAWQKIIFGAPESYLDRIVSAGFDGARHRAWCAWLALRPP